MKRLLPVLVNILLLAALAVFAWRFRTEIVSGWRLATDRVWPCSRPIAYSLGTFDQQFGLSRKDFLASLATATAAWSQPVGRPLFAAEADGSLKINLIYDERQAATDRLKKLGFDIRNSEQSYDALKAKYETLKASYETDKTGHQTAVALFEAARRDYEKQVQAWNEKGGAPRPEFERLNVLKAELDAQAARLNAAAESLNKIVAELNDMVTTLNRLARNLNKTAESYNELAGSRGEEFQEGRFVSDAGGQRIDIYEYDDRTALTRVLMHEFGHALGLDHSESPADIMFRLNQGATDKLSVGDAAAIRTKCRISE
ncbi:hypothetical protein A3C96_02380 [Candidatus Uhrbacteria bacterium RIFCSPHIGHO2_02_FULL_60_10]|uniref:Peptidase M10 metallopeptidase domain-containing protein n=1 Tax=Candidatus Uhrbacteria bacterium RIFCSPHIGHO2_02_FULL_60_10 TaxID=1802392 RepID=A0A1F7U6K9_9BACT|nr:MAG: hypothetical protein A3C96_02380 [Candidatus Uhrbacteria bacterium RIFCSPHIGHO2_02_FULL_60_10]